MPDRPPPATAAGTLVIGGDLEVHRLGLGAMRLCGEDAWGPPADRAAAHEVLRVAVHELGIDFIDTADAYGPDVAETLIAEALRPYLPGLVLATKGGYTRPGPEDWVPNGRPKHLRRALEGSLRRLRLERIDLYQLHTPDPDVPVEESVGELERLRQEGKIRHVGVSNLDVEQLERARRETRPVSVQNRYNVLEQEDDEVIAWCEANDAVYIPWRPVAAGTLEDARVRAAADRLGATPHQVALAWLLRRSPVVLPIPGTSSVEHVRENAAAAEVELDEEAWQELREG